jgi:hypothetical protein
MWAERKASFKRTRASPVSGIAVFRPQEVFGGPSRYDAEHDCHQANRFVLLQKTGLLGAQLLSQDHRTEIAKLISTLYREPWQGAVNLRNPTSWNFNFTQPMKRLLEIGSSAQQPLLAKLLEPEITAKSSFCSEVSGTSSRWDR